MATSTTMFEQELLAGGFTLTDRGLMAGPAYRLRQAFNAGQADPLAHQVALINPEAVDALTRNGKLASFNAILGA